MVYSLSMEFLSIIEHLSLLIALILYPAKVPVSFYMIAAIGIFQTYVINLAYINLSASTYFDMFYGFSLVNFLLYFECSRKTSNTRLCGISYLMRFYMVMKMIAYFTLGHESFRYEWGQLLRFVNVIMVLLFTVILLDETKGANHARRV